MDMSWAFVTWSLTVAFGLYLHGIHGQDKEKLTEKDFCLSQCKRGAKHNGDFQSCDSCNQYITCVWGRMFPGRKCAVDADGIQEEWDDYKKHCVKAGTSKTCGYGMIATTQEPTTQGPTTEVTTTEPFISTCAPEATTVPAPTEGTGTTRVGQCITSCAGLRNGDYQSCYGCHVFATCYDGDFFDNRPCSVKANLVWNDRIKLCVWLGQDSTCDAPPEGYSEEFISREDEDEDKSRNRTTRPRGEPGVVVTEAPDQTVCRLIRTQVLNMTVNFTCLAPEITQTRCEGQCVSSQLFTGQSSEPWDRCACCKASELETISVNVTCGEGNFTAVHTYDIAKRCSCEPCTQ